MSKWTMRWAPVALGVMLGVGLQAAAWAQAANGAFASTRTRSLLAPAWRVAVVVPWK